MTALLQTALTLPPTRLCALLAPLVFVLPTSAVAQGFFWADGYQAQDIYTERPPLRLPRPPVLPKSAEKAEKAAAEGRKPQGPLVIAISIQRQQMKVYDAKGLFAESPISSGMAGHATPMGVFSVIQKHKFHRSNIYSGAPMPYMQRVTWSGVAMHAGVLPGYPASHGCIRLPMSFAMKMWGWTRMGARVVVTPGEVSPADFAHPTLASLVPPAPAAEAPVARNVRTADASGHMAGGAPKVMADLATGGIAATTETPVDVATVASIVAAEAQSDLAAADTAANDGLPAVPAPVAADFTDVEIAAEDSLREGVELAAQTPPEAEAIQPELTVGTDVAATGSAAATPAVTPVEVSPPTRSEPVAPVADAATVPTPPLIKRNLPVAIFVSRKDGKIYVRQNFKPLFDMPIQIAAGDGPLGTHVFTARPADDDVKLQWSVVTLPAAARQASGRTDERGGRNRNAGVVAAVPAALSPGDALARLTIPDDLMARLGDALPPGSSLVVSDQGIAQGETGEGTDFIVRLR